MPSNVATVYSHTWWLAPMAPDCLPIACPVCFRWWRLLPCVIVWWVALVRFCLWIPSDSTLAPVLQTLSEALQKPLRRLGRTQACALRYSLIRWWVSTVGLSLPVVTSIRPCPVIAIGIIHILFPVFLLTLHRVVCLRLAWGSYTGTHTLSTWILHLISCGFCGGPLAPHAKPVPTLHPCTTLVRLWITCG